jgi:hypothetical protein
MIDPLTRASPPLARVSQNLQVLPKTAGWLIGTTDISSVTEQDPCRRRSNNVRRVGSPSASNVDILAITYISINLSIYFVKSYSITGM